MTGTLGVGANPTLQAKLNELVHSKMSAPTAKLKRQEVSIDNEVKALKALEDKLNAFKKTIEDLSKPDKFGSLKTTIAGDGNKYISATADSAARPGSYQVSIEQLAERHKISVFKQGKTVPPGDYQISVNGKTLELKVTNDDNDLKSIMNTINQSKDNPGVSATIINGNQLVLTSKESGKDNTVSMTSTDKALEQQIQQTTLQKGLDAKLKIDGVEVSSPSNEVKEAVTGVTLNLKNISKVTDGKAEPSDWISNRISQPWSIRSKNSLTVTTISSKKLKS